MEITGLQLVGSILGSAGIKPMFDYMSGRTQAKRDTEARLWQEIEDLKKVATATNERLDKAKARIAELHLTNEREKRSWEKRLGDLEDQLADLQANNEALTGELSLTKDHVADLSEQVKQLGGIPRPAPTQPREADGQFGEIHGRYSKNSKKKGKR